MKNSLLHTVLLASLLAAPSAHAQPVRFAVGVGVAPVYVGPPVCRYGYYGYYPYRCAPYGYYGPEWFVSGVFIGAGPWFHPYHGWRGGYGYRGYYRSPGYYGRSDFRGAYGREGRGWGGYRGGGYGHEEHGRGGDHGGGYGHGGRGRR